jgi:hypothetical protein
VNLMSDNTSTGSIWERRRWISLGVIGIAQLMAVLDATVINIALPSAPRALGLHHVGPAMGGHRLPWRSAACCCPAADSPT